MTEDTYGTVQIAEKWEDVIDWCEYVWQYAESREEAIKNHCAKHDEAQDWVDAGNKDKKTY